MNNNKDFRKDFLDSEEESLICRYEEMLAQGRSCYFDVSECEDIINYYGERCEVKKAMQALTLAEKLHPLSPSIRLIKASLFAFDNKPRKALNIIAELEQSESAYELDMFRLRISKALALISVGKIEQAIKLQQELLDSEAARNIDVEQVLAVISTALLEQEKYEEVIQNLQSFEDKIQLSSTLLGYMAFAFTELADFEAGEEYYKKSVEQNPFDPALWCDMADMLTDFDEAIAAYDYALVLDEKMAQAYCGKAELLNDLGMTEKAEETLLNGVKACPDDADIYDMLADHYEETQDYDNAIACCKKMLAEDPRRSNLWIVIARILIAMKKYEEALEACNAAISLDEDMNVYTYDLKACIYNALGLPDKELETYKAMLQANAHDIEMVHAVGLVYEERDEYDTAGEIYATAIGANPEEPTLYAKMALLLDNLDISEEAYKYAQHAVALDDQDSFSWSLMASLELEWKKNRKMLRSLKNALTCREYSLGALVVLYEAVKLGIPGAKSLIEDAADISIDTSIAHCYMAALFFALKDAPRCLSHLEQALIMDAEDSLRFFLRICPEAKNIPEMKNLRKTLRKANKKH
ncbi:MAG: tetratricopeptide repeat protein [Prevotellaceae bacterium]|nr:tetratricopeptide repeat protein [Prevotellaceae bacterium]